MNKLILASLLISVLLVSGCAGNTVNPDNAANGLQQSPDDSSTAANNSSDGTSPGEEALADPPDLFSSRDFEVDYDESANTVIQLNGDTAVCNSDTVKISGSTVTITDEGIYILSGILNDGMIIVDSEKTDKIRLVLDNVSITSETSAPIYILQADKVFITLAPGSSNTLSNGGTFTAIDGNNIDAVIFSREDLTLNGSGSLKISSPAGHGIVSKDELTLTGGAYAIDSASHGLEGKDNVCIANAEIGIVSGKDGIHAENSDDATLGFVYIQSGVFDISSGGDGVSASAWMQIDDGTFSIVSGGGSANAEIKTSDFRGSFMGGAPRPGNGSPGGNYPNSAQDGNAEENSTSSKGIKASGNLVINGGSFEIDAADDAVHTNASMDIIGGTFEISTGDDGFHADDTVSIANGAIRITKSYEGIEGLHVKISGGDITIYASDDGINAAGGTDRSGFGGMRGNDRFGGRPGSTSSNGSVDISGGRLYINARGDGIDANGTLAISGGYTVVCGPVRGDTATLDYDISGTITGGTFIGTGASRMAQTFSNSEQGVISVRMGTQPAGTAISLKDSAGNTVIPSYAPELDFEVVILSSPDIVKGETYTLTIGSASRAFVAN